MRRRKTLNPKRRVQSKPSTDRDLEHLRRLADAADYGGNPEHKRNPGDFGLDPPSSPRQGKSLCDGAGIFSRAEALGLLREGLRRGLVSVQERGGWPQNVWAVTKTGVALEAMLENPSKGVYHGYPMLDDDPLIEEIFERWSDRQ